MFRVSIVVQPLGTGELAAEAQVYVIATMVLPAVGALGNVALTEVDPEPNSPIGEYCTTVGALLAPTGVIELEADDCDPVPAALIAATVKV